MEELMATTPNSSLDEGGAYGAYAFRSAYMYNSGKPDRNAVGQKMSGPVTPPRRSKNLTEEGVVKDELDFFHEEDGDVLSAKKVVSGANKMKGDSKDLFVKHEVPRIFPPESASHPKSLLSSALAATEMQKLTPSSTPMHSDDCIRSRGNTGSHSLTSDVDNESACTPSVSGNSDIENEDWAVCSVRHFITAVLAQNRISGVVPHLTMSTADQLSLRIADEEEADSDYPELDMDVAVVDIGVKQFVLCPQGQSNALLVVNLDLQRNVRDKDGRCMNLQVNITFWKPGAARSELSHIVASTSIGADTNVNTVV